MTNNHIKLDLGIFTVFVPKILVMVSEFGFNPLEPLFGYWIRTKSLLKFENPSKTANFSLFLRSGQIQGDK